MQYVRIRKNDFILGAMLILSVVHLFGCYISWQGAALAFILFSAALWGRTKFEFTYLDLTVCVVILYELVLVFTSINKPPASTYAMMAFYTWSCYFICRLCLTSFRQFRIALFGMTCIIFLILIIGVISFLLFRQRVFDAGFNTLYEFRFLLSPWGNTINLWTTFLVAFQGIILLTFLYYRRNKTVQVFVAVTFALLVWNGMASFSRTLYLLFIIGFFVLSAGLIAKKFRRMALLLVTFILTAITFCIVNGTKDVFKVLKITASTSQQRSIDARQYAFSIFGPSTQGNRFFGVGNGNYTLAVNNDLYENDDISYTNFVSSGPLQLATEKGILGAILWLSLFTTIIVCLLKCRSLSALLAIYSIIMLGLKESTFGVFTDFPSLQCWFIIPVTGVLNLHRRSGIAYLSITRLKYTYLILLAQFTLFSTIHLRQEINRKNCDELIAAIESGTEDPKTYLSLETTELAYLINKTCLLGERYLSSGHPDDYRHAVACLQKAIDRNSQDNMPFYNLALLYAYAGQTTDARRMLESLILRCPNNALFRIGLAQVLHRQGNIPLCADQYARAILIDPRIMDTSQWKNLKTGKSELFYYICNTLQEIIPHNTTNPIQMAKNGKILFELGDTSTGASSLQQAVVLLPYLGKAWYNLGIISDMQGEHSKAKECFKKAQLFNPEDSFLHSYITGENLSQEIKTSDISLKTLTRSYDLKFRTWYRSRPYKNQVMLRDIFQIN